MPFIATAIASIATAFGASAATATAIGAFGLKLAGSLLLSAASSALMPKPAQNLQNRTVTVREPVAPRSLVYGRTRKGGVMVFLNSRPANGLENQTLQIIVVLAAHRVKSISAIYFNGEAAWRSVGGAQGRYNNALSVEVHLGGTGVSPFPILAGNSGGLWTYQQRLDGCAAIGLQLAVNADAYPNGVPNITVDMEGKDDILDPRTALRGYTSNAALCLADYMSLVPFGLGAAIGSADGIDSDALIEAANVCDEWVSKVEGGSEQRYSCDGVVTLDQTPKTVIEAMLTAMAGTCAWQGGSWRIHAGAYRVPVIALTGNDVREGGLTVSTRVSRSANFNAVRGQFVSPENDWQPDDFPAYQSVAYLIEDNNELVWRDISLPFTISASAAQRLARIELERNRRQMTLSVQGKLAAWRCATGETVTFDYARWGWAAKPFEVASVTLDLNGGDDGAQMLPEIVLRETSPLVYVWNTSEAAIYAAAPRSALPSAFDVAAPGGLTVTEDLYQTRDGAGVRALARLIWSASPSAFVVTYQVEARLAGGAWMVQGRTDGATFEILDIAPGDWEFRVKALNGLGVSSVWVEVAQEIIGLGAPPIAITGLTIQAAGGIAILKWDLHPDLDVRVGGYIRIRHSAAVVPTWANSVSMDSVPGGTAQALPPLKPGSYVLRAEDAGGNLGPEAVIATGGAQVVLFLTGTTLTEDATFTGTKVGTILDTGTLRLNTTGDTDAEASWDAIPNLDALGGVLTTGSYAFATAMNLGSVKSIRLRSVIRHSVVGILDNVDNRPGSVDTWLSFDGTDGGETDVVVECRTTTDNPAGSPVWGPWGRVENTEIQAWGVQARAILTSTDAGYTPAVDQLRLIAQEAA